MNNSNVNLISYVNLIFTQLNEVHPLKIVKDNKLCEGTYTNPKKVIL